jgi:hypothetical protein
MWETGIDTLHPTLQTEQKRWVEQQNGDAQTRCANNDEA